MWPQALQMTRDECRGILRRLELESYSNVISVFRAQGGLSENKAKLLEELRNIFHISQERHRAEARRVANDEQLSTIAEAISGPNTWQEWSREGRRSFPMLPRVAPQTALALIANNVAAETAAENAKLPYPSETAAPVAAEQATQAEAKSATPESERKSWNIVSCDPFKVPEIPSQIPKKPLKRNLPESQTASIKRRIVNDSSSAKAQQQQKLRQQPSSESGNTITSTSNIRKLYNNHSKLQQQQKVYQQQLHKQKLAAKKNSTQTKRQPSAKGKKAQILKEQQQVQQSQIKPHQPSDVDQHTSSHANKPIDVQIEASEESHDATHVMPQIAASKKDISKNLTKLHIPLPTGATPTCQISSSPRITPIESSSSVSASSSSITSNTVPSVLGSKADKQLISTPVQKYIVEDRQSPAVQVSSPQILTLPQLSAAASKLRTMNTTILPPGTKLTKRLPTATVLTTGTGGVVSGATEQNSNQPQVFNIIEGTTITTSNITSTAHPSTPTHTPPAVIQLNNNSLSSTVNSTDSISTTPTQGKVLTTKLLPIVLSGTGAHNKIETLNNGATIVAAGGGSTSTVTSSVFKTIPSSMLVSTSGSNTNLISTSITSGTHSVFRKPPNIIKTGIIGVSSGASSTAKISSTFNANTSLSGTGTQILSNIKLKPAVVNTTTSSTTTPQFLKNVTASGIRTSVKICQSPNGKMFIQPANADALKSAKLQTSLQQKLLANQASATSGASTPTPPQRIAIQKVQIIPAPMSSPGSIPGTLQLQQQQQQQKPTSSLSISNKANMIFMPATCGARGTPTITLSKGSISNITSKSQQPMDVSKQNVFVIGAVAPQQQHNQSLKSSVSRETTQMITEDTPVDILNMPIIVDNSSSTASNSASSGSSTITVNNIGDTVTVLTNDYVESSSGKQTKSQHSAAVVLGVTDWEMELDQATAVAAATKAACTQRRSTSIKSRKSVDQQQKSELQQNSTIVVDDNFDDVIVEETFIDEGVDEESQESSTDVDIVMMADNENQTEYMQQYKVSNAQSDDDINIDVVDEDHNQQQKRECGNKKMVTDEGTKTSQLIILKSNEGNIDETYDEAIAAEMDENTAIEYIEEDHNESFDDEKSNSKLMRVLEETNNIEHVVVNKTSSTTSEFNNEVKNLTSSEDGNKNINSCDLDESCKESNYELVQTETLEERQSPITTESSSRDEQ